MQTLTVPDIGDSSQIPVIEAPVRRGVTVALEQPALTLESGKATIDLPRAMAGTIRSVLPKKGAGYAR
ncbi:hypothetical protein LJR296_007490 [Cupriavidus necator]|uniref:biotin/lipoyl-containing protein n=1 Tax=Cupriavidus necator TaxID=106590 RepID=UPI003ED13D55